MKKKLAPKKIPSTELEQLASAQWAMKHAIAPYSHFHVGAAIRAHNGLIINGHNIESSSYSLTICAERVALFKALSEGISDFESIIIISNSGAFCPPCGACRQVLMDFAPSLEIILADSNLNFKRYKLSDLLPESFSKKNLDLLTTYDLPKASRKTSASKSINRKN